MVGSRLDRIQQCRSVWILHKHLLDHVCILYSVFLSARKKVVSWSEFGGEPKLGGWREAQGAGLA